MICTRCGATISEESQFCPACGQSRIPGVAPPVATRRVAYAGFWLRAVAYLIDGALVSVVTAPFWFFVFLGMMRRNLVRVGGQPPDPATMGRMFGAIALFELILLLAMWLYFAWTESSSWQATLGKKALGIRVTDLGGRRISFGRATGRYFAKLISGFAFCIGFIIAGFTEKKQALHDMIAGTLAVKGS